jgi:hypothetical protein
MGGDVGRAETCFFGRDALAEAVFPVGSGAVHLIVTAAVILTGLLAKGAIAAFYLRERGSYGDDGAAYIGWADDEGRKSPCPRHRRSRSFP